MRFDEFKLIEPIVLYLKTNLHSAIDKGLYTKKLIALLN